MFDFLQTVLAFIACLGVLIAVHEYGHFWVARRCGVKVIRFSIGFGSPLFKWYDRLGTEYVIAALPIGGYVKMLGEPGSEVPEEQRHEAFMHKTVWQRIAIVAAGPVVNLVFAVLLYWVIFVVGITRVAPVIGEVQPDSIAAQAGLQSGMEIIAVDGEATQSWEKVNFALVARLGESGSVEIKTKDPMTQQERTHILSVNRYMIGKEKEGPLAALGIEQYRPRIPVILGELVPDMAAETQGLKTGDRIISVNGVELHDWFEWVDLVQANPGIPLELLVDRNGQKISITLIPEAQQDESGQMVGRIGAYPEPWEVPDNMIREISYSPVAAVGEALAKTWNLISLTLSSIQKMLVGAISLDNLSGPITIAKVAGNTVNYGIEPFLNFMAYLSISLGVLNLLPIPVLDGGHLMYYLVELFKGSPVSERTQQIGNLLGLVLLVTFMGLAFYNDIVGL